MTRTRSEVAELLLQGFHQDCYVGMRSECQQLVAAAFWFGDSRAEEAFAQCFTPDGALDRAGDLISGREGACAIRSPATANRYRFDTSIACRLLLFTINGIF